MEKKLLWECSFLARNEQPKDSEGKSLPSLDYSESSFNDSHAKTLSQNLLNNTTFTGGILLPRNFITDQGVLDLCSSLTRSGTPLTVLDLSYNNLKGRSGLYIGNYLGVNKNPLTELSMNGCHLGEMGLRRVLESLPTNSTLKSLSIGQLTENSIYLLAQYIPQCRKLHYLALEQLGDWSPVAQAALATLFSENESLRTIEIQTKFPDLKEELESYAHRNRHAHHKRCKCKELRSLVSPPQYARCIQNAVENSIQSLPVRVYLKNALGTILNDAVYEMFKFRDKENDPEAQTAAENVKWLVRYLIDNHLQPPSNLSH